MQKVLVFFLGVFLVIGLLVWWSYRPVKVSRKKPIIQKKANIKITKVKRIEKPKVKYNKVSDKYTVSYYKNGTLVSAGTINTVSIPSDYKIVKKTKDTVVINRGSDTYVYDKID